MSETPDRPPDDVRERLKQPRIFVAGHQGMVGSAILRALKTAGAEHVIIRSRQQLDLERQEQVEEFFAQERPETVVFAAGKVGGIQANQAFPAEFMHRNLVMAVLAIDAAFRAGVGRFLYLGSTCIYPRDAVQPMPEKALLASPLEPTNEPYALAKIGGLKLCQFYRRQYGVSFHSAMPTNLYGPGDNYHPEHSHVLPGLMQRFHHAKLHHLESVAIWGTGTPRREFLHVDDLADAILHLLCLDEFPDWVNIGTGVDITIRELSEMIAQIVGFSGRIEHDESKPDGTPIKRTDTALLRSLGWHAKIQLREGIERTYQSYISELETATIRS